MNWGGVRGAGFLLFVAILLAGPAALAANHVPLDEKGFTETLARDFARTMPDKKVVVEAPLVLNVTDAKGEVKTVNLHNLYSDCRRNPTFCDRYAELHVVQISEFEGVKDAPIKRTMLRAIVRPVDYVITLFKTAQAGPGKKAEPIAAQWVGELWMVCAVDYPTAIGMLRIGDLEQLALTPGQALALCQANVGAKLGPVEPTERDHGIKGVHLIAGDSYQSSLLLFPERFAEEAKKSRGALLVAVPGPDVILYHGGRSAKAAKDLTKVAGQVAQKLRRPFPIEIFRWTKDGWEPVEEP